MQREEDEKSLRKELCYRNEDGKKFYNWKDGEKNKRSIKNKMNKGSVKSKDSLEKNIKENRNSDERKKIKV